MQGVLTSSLVEKLTEAGVNVIVPDTCSKISIVNEKIKMVSGNEQKTHTQRVRKREECNRLSPWALCL